MNIAGIIKEVKAINESLGSVLDGSSHHVLDSVLADLNAHEEQIRVLRRKATKPPWVLRIEPSRPIRFRDTSEEPLVKHNLEVDLCCELSEPDVDGRPTGRHNIAVRVWATDPQQFFRPALDSEHIRQDLLLRKRRVMLRFHFDLADCSQQGPRYHLQIGGKSPDSDYSWFPDNWKLPRFFHVPVNLVLACEFIVRTFFPSRFVKIAQEQTWIGAIRSAEAAYLLPFLGSLPFVRVDYSQHKKSLLSSVWND